MKDLKVIFMLFLFMQLRFNLSLEESIIGTFISCTHGPLNLLTLPLKKNIEETVQTTHIHLDNAMKQTQQQLYERFDKANGDMQQHVREIHISMDNEKHVVDTYMSP